MKLLRQIFQKKYCLNCQTVKRYEHSIFRLLSENEKLKSESHASKKAVDFIRKTVDTDMNVIHFKITGDFIEVITVQSFYDYQCKLETLEFYGYFFDACETGRIIAQTLSVDAFYGEMVDSDNIRNYYLKNFYIAALNCKPNKGYGSIMMEQFLKYIKPFGAKYINGILSSYDTQDDVHKARLFHFYKKFNFEIGEINESGDYPIRLYLY